MPLPLLVLLLAPLLAPLQEPAAPPAGGAAPAANAAADDAGPAVLRIEGEPIARDRYRDWLLRTRGEVEARSFADAWLVAREAERLGVADVADEVRALHAEEVARRVENAHRGDREAWLRELAAVGRTPEGRAAEREAELEVERRLAAIAALDREIPPERIRREWEARYGKAGRRLEVRLLQRKLVVPTVPGETREERQARREELRAALEQEVREIRERALAGESFAGLARALSQDARTRDAGGSPGGPFDPTGWPADVLDMLSELEPGEVSEPIFARGGYWLVKVESVDETPLAEVEEELRALLVERGPEPDEVQAALERVRGEVVGEPLPALWAAPAEGREARPDEEPVLRIGDEAVSREAFGAWLLRVRGEVLARRFAEHWRIRRLAEEEGIEVSDEAVHRRVEEDLEQTIQAFYDGDREKWLAAVTGAGRTEASWRREQELKARDDLVLEALVLREREVTPEDVRRAWEERYGPGGRKREMRLIRVDAELERPDPGTSREEVERRIEEAVAAAREEAEEVVRRYREGEDFGALARRFSDEAHSRENAGRPPADFRLTTIPAEIADAIRALEPGQVTEPIALGGAFLVVELVGMVETPLEGVREALREELATARPSMVELAARRNVLTRDLRVEVLPALHAR